MVNTFDRATAFNQSLERWDVSRVLAMDSMFDQAYSFNQPLGGWDTARVTSANSMFSEAHSLSVWSEINGPG